MMAVNSVLRVRVSFVQHSDERRFFNKNKVTKKIFSMWVTKLFLDSFIAGFDNFFKCECEFLRWRRFILIFAWLWSCGWMEVIRIKFLDDIEFEMWDTRSVTFFEFRNCEYLVKFFWEHLKDIQVSCPSIHVPLVALDTKFYKF